MVTCNPKTLIDGRVVDSASEEWRAECEARYALGLHRIERGPFLDGVKQRRGERAWTRLLAGMQSVRRARP
jgi:hypothetical protein